MCSGYCCYFFFFFKQNTAYEMRISDWSSDVCSSDLLARPMRRGEHPEQRRPAESEADPDVGDVQFGADGGKDRLHRGIARRRDEHHRKEHRHAIGGEDRKSDV